MKIIAKKCKLGRPALKTAQPVAIPQKHYNIGYGPGQLRPDCSRDPQVESRQFARLTQAINGMSGQLN